MEVSRAFALFVVKAKKTSSIPNSVLTLTPPPDHDSMKFKFCGDADAPDWVLAEMFTISKLSSVRVRSLSLQIIRALIASGDDVTMYDGNDVDPTTLTSSSSSLDHEKLRKLIDASGSFADADVEAVVAALEYVVRNATRHDVHGKTLTRELEQLGLPKEHADAVCKPYEKEKEGLRRSMGRRTLRTDALKDLRWGVAFSTSDTSSEEGGSVVGEAGLRVKLTMETERGGRVAFVASEEKFRVLLGELKTVKALMDEDA